MLHYIAPNPIAAGGREQNNRHPGRRIAGRYAEDENRRRLVVSNLKNTNNNNNSTFECYLLLVLVIIILSPSLSLEAYATPNYEEWVSAGKYSFLIDCVYTWK